MASASRTGFTVLGDAAVQEILTSLSKDEIIWFQDEFSKALMQFSVDGERQYQPAPGVIVRPDGQKTLFRTFTSPSAVGTKIIVDRNNVSTDTTAQPSDLARNKGTPMLRGILAICDNTGVPAAIINAEEVTAYRTSLCALIPFMWRRNVEKIVVFGAGKQASWHIRLALALRGSEIKKITIVNRSYEKAQALRSTLEEQNRSAWQSDATLDCLSLSSESSEERSKTLLGNANVVFCTTPSKKPLFPASYLVKHTEDRQGAYVSAIGSWQPEMIELDPALLRYAVGSVGADHSADEPKGLIIADDTDHALQTGELIQSGLSKQQMVELGDLLASNRQAKSQQPPQNHDGHLDSRLEAGLLIYKSVGVGLMDLAAGSTILSLAQKRNKGAIIPDF